MKFYLDTSVFGGFFDNEFKEDTIKLFKYIVKNDLKVIYSVLTKDELSGAPKKVGDLRESLPNKEIVGIDSEVLSLAKLYIMEGTLSEKSFNDAQHIAAATVGGASAVVSWNFKHMVNFLKIKGYNTVNVREGYRTISIHTPTEMINHYE